MANNTTEDKKNKVIIKSNNLIEARYNLSSLEQKLLLITISEIKNSEKNTIEFTTKELYNILNITTNRQNELRKTLETLVNKSIIIIDKSLSNRKKTLVTHWFSSVTYNENGTIQIAFDTELLPYLLQLKTNFTTYTLDNILPMKKKYSIRFYELLKQYQKIGKRNFTISELREILNCEKEYPRFQSFEQRIIDPAVKEINQYTDIEIEYNKFKKGKSISEVEFIIKSKRAVENTKEIITACDEFEKLTQTELEKLKNDYPMSEIVEAYDYVRKSTHSHKIKNWYAYLLTVLKTNHKPKQLMIDGGKLPPSEEKEILLEQENKQPDFEMMKKNLLNQFKI